MPSPVNSIKHVGRNNINLIQNLSDKRERECTSQRFIWGQYDLESKT